MTWPPAGGRRAYVVPAAVLLLAGLVSGGAQAHDHRDTASEPPAFFTRIQFSGSLRSGYWSSSRDLDDRAHLATAALWLKAQAPLSSQLHLTVEGWVRSDDLVREQMSWGELREAYLDLRLDTVDVRIGKQIIVWGRADRLNPTDNLTPRDFTLLTVDDDDQRVGTPAIRLSYFFDRFSLTGIWLPLFTPHTIPLPHLAPTMRLREHSPSPTFAQWAVKLDHSGGVVDWSLSYFDGYDVIPDLRLGRVRTPAVPVTLTHNRIRVIGADAASTVGRFGLRGEAAYTFTSDPHGRDPLVKNSFFFLVLGVERTFLEYLNVNVQYLLRVLTRFRDVEDLRDPFRRSAAGQIAAVTSQRDAIQHGASLRIGYRWWQETVETECAAVLSFTRLDFLLRPKVVYAVSDRWTVALGGDVVRGSRRTVFGRLRQNASAYLEIRYNF